MVNLLSLSPLMRSTVGFDRFNDLFEQLVDSADKQFDSYPPYNIEKTGDDQYKIVMAVAGFTMNDLTITAQGESLTVAGKMEEKTREEGTTFLHRGIATRSFQRNFRLADHIKVVSADMNDGLLTINLVRDVPEEAKPRMIPINGKAPAIEGKKQN
jgi:molecular chaperone IbpA